MLFKKKQVSKGESIVPQPAQKSREATPSQVGPAGKEKAHLPSVPASQNNKPQNKDGTEDLVRRVMGAIDEWAIANKLNAMPRNIVFQQALSLLNAVDRNLDSKK